MFIRRNLAFVSSTYPWVWGSFLTWWLDRLLVELGHRTTSAPLCNHSNIQYVRLHCYVSQCAIVCQSVYSIKTRLTQFNREKILLGIDSSPPCRTLSIAIYLLQAGICLAWSVVIACLADVSPWLCQTLILEHRASIAASSLLGIVVLIYTEQFLYSYTIKRALENTTFEI